MCMYIARRDLVQVQVIVQKLENRNQLNQHKELVSAATSSNNKIITNNNNANHAFQPSSNAAINSLTNMFTQEIKIAKTLMRLIEIQNSFVSDVESAMLRSDVVGTSIPFTIIYYSIYAFIELNRLLVKSKRLEMQNHPIVIKGHERLLHLHRVIYLFIYVTT